jgi:hypothetical protein
MLHGLDVGIVSGSIPSIATRVFTDSEGHPAVLEVNHTFSNKSLGDAASDRIIVIAGGSGGYNPAVTGVTVGGNSCTEAIQFADTARAWIYYVALPTGTTGDVVVTFASAEFRSIIGVYAIYGASGGPADTATGGGTSGTVTASIDKTENGVTIGAFFQSNFNSATQNAAWTNLTEDAEVSADDSGSGGFASAENTADATGQTITVVSDSADGRQPLVVASWGAA